MRKLGKIFSEKLDKKQYVAKPANWQAMEKLLDKKMPVKRGFIFKWWLSVIAIVLSVAGIIAFFSFPKTSINKSSAENSILMNTSIAINNKQPDAIGETKGERNTKKSSEPMVEFVPEKLLRKAKKNEVISTSIAKTKDKNNDQAFQNNMPDNVVNEPKFNENSRKKIRTAVIALDSANQQELFSLPIESKVSEEGKADISMLREEQRSEGTTADIPLLKVAHPNLHFLLMNSVFQRELLMDKDSIILNSTVMQSNQGTRKPSFYAGIYGGAMYSGKTLESSDTLLNEYISRRKEEETGMFTYNSGIDLGLNYGNWILGSGINYHRQGEITQYKNEFLQWIGNDSISWQITDSNYMQVNTTNLWIYTDSNYWETTYDTVVYWNENISAIDTELIPFQEYVINNIDSQLFSFTDSNFVQLKDSSEIIYKDSSLQKITDASQKLQREKNKITYIEIPLLIGYEIPISRFTISAKTGIGIGILSKQERTYLKTDVSGKEKFKDINTRQIIWNYLLKIGFNYYFTNNISLNTEPFFRMNLANSFTKPTGVVQKYWNAGINVGVNYRF